VSANTRTVLRLLLESRVDLALVEGPVDHARVDVIPWRQDELVIIAPPDHHLLKHAPAPVALVSAEPFLVREPGSGTRDVSERALARHGVKLTNTMRVGGTEAIKQAVAAGLGLAIVSRFAAADQLALGRIAVLDVQGLEIRRTFTRLQLRERVMTVPARELQMLLSESDAERGVPDASGVA
jgi:DNA-binding transcriptional LysR family regulator